MKRKLPAIFAILFCGLFLATTLTAQEWKYLGTVTSDASIGESAILVKTDAPVVAGRTILIESRDGMTRETYQVRHVYGHTVLLEEHLRQPFVSGSKVFQ